MCRYGKQKHADAKEQATGELQSMRLDTKNQIKELQKESEEELAKVRLLGWSK